MIPYDSSITVFHAFHQPIRKDFLSAQLITSVDQSDGAANITQIKRFFHRRITAAYNRHVLLAKEKTIAGCAGGNTFTHELFFGRQTEITGIGSGSDDQCST